MVGLFFGSFNPIHNGHLRIARYLLDYGYCKEVWFVVSPQNPLKQDKSLLSEAKRLEMVQVAIADNVRMKACDIEFFMPKPSYTIDTLRKLDEQYGSLAEGEIKKDGKKFALIIGGDNLRDFPLWKDYRKIASDYPIFVYPRPGIDHPGAFYGNVVLIDAPLSAVSSTEIRRKVQHREDITPDVPPEIAELVKRNYEMSFGN